MAEKFLNNLNDNFMEWQKDLATGPDIISKRLDEIDACDHIYDETDHCFECDHPKPKENISDKKFEDKFSENFIKKLEVIFDILDYEKDNHLNNETLKEMIRLLVIMAQCEGEMKIIKMVENSTYGGKK